LKVAFPVPTMTIGAELDGLCRITRIAEALYSQVHSEDKPFESTPRRSMILIVRALLPW